MYDLRIGDALELIKELPDNSVDTILTSPPYNLTGLRGQKLDRSYKPSAGKEWTSVWSHAGVEYESFQDNLPEEVYHEQQVLMINECIRVLKPEGSFFYQHKIRQWQRTAHHPMEWILKSDARLHQEIIWDRRNTPALDKRILFPTTERIYWLAKKKPVVFKSMVEHKKDIWSIGPDNGNEHPAPFPFELADNCIKLSTPEGGVVLDPYNGSGTTGVAALANKCSFIGFDLSEKYTEQARRRMDRYTNLGDTSPIND